jgi:alpha-tubulin suppressor-like RCC1 family protein
MKRKHGCKSVRTLLYVLPLALSALHSIPASAQYRLRGIGSDVNGQLASNRIMQRSVPGPATSLTGIVAIAANQETSYALRSDGTLWAWGYNFNSELGDGTEISRSAPVSPLGLDNVVAFAAGSLCLAVKTDGTVWAWGTGYLGDGSAIATYTMPTQVSTLAGVKSVACNGNQYFALKTDGSLWAWGDNYYGQLGQDAVVTQLSPIQIPLSGVIDVSCGIDHTLALKSDGTVWVWGRNNFGQLGNGSSSGYVGAPQQVSGLSGITSIAAGATFNFAVTSSGAVYAWGDNQSGELGIGSTVSQSLPVRISALSGIVAVAATRYLTDYTFAASACALKRDGTVWAWGDNSYGELGDGTTANRLSPVQVSGLTGCTGIAMNSFGLAIQQGGSLASWGQNSYGELGVDTPPFRTIPAPQPTPTTFKAAASTWSSGLGLTSNGIVYTWGNFVRPQTGAPSTLRAGAAPVPGLTGVVAITGGGSAGYALTGDGAMWEIDGAGLSAVATRIADLTNVVAISGQGFALKSDGSVWIRGNGGSPSTQVSGLANIVAIYCGDGHYFALDSYGTLYGWGFDGSGELGDGGTNNIIPTDPHPIPVSNVASVSAGDYTSLLLTTDGTVWSTGGGATYFTQVQGLSGITAVMAGEYDHLFALKGDGTLYAWGTNETGELGLGDSLFATNNPTQSTPQQVLWAGRVTRLVSGGIGSSLILTADPDPDFNGDGNHDLVWQNAAAGDVDAWLMSGATWTNNQQTLATGVSANWKLVAATDLNGDGQTDLLWQNTRNGSVVAWLMNGSTRTGLVQVAANVPAHLKVVGVADFNGDGQPDLLWQDTVTGAVSVWYMNGLTWTGRSDTILAGAPANWQVIGTADFNGDGKPDLLWYNSRAGNVAVWLMQGIVWDGTWRYLARGVSPLVHPVAAIDMNGDGKPDLLWQDVVNGTVTVWFLNGLTRQGGAATVGPARGVQWTLAPAH